MNDTLIGVMFGAGFGVWVYTIMMRNTGSQTKPSLLVGALAGLVGFFVIFTLLGIIFPS